MAVFVTVSRKKSLVFLSHISICMPAMLNLILLNGGSKLLLWKMPVYIVELYRHLLTLVLYRYGRSQWPRPLRRRSVAARLLRVWVRIPPGAWVFVCCECSVLSGRGSLRRADHSSRGVLPTVMSRVWSRNLVNEEAMAHWGLSRQKQTLYRYEC